MRTILTKFTNDRRVLSLLDQSVSSLSNLLLAVLVARHVSVAEFGIYAIVASIYWFCLGGLRALVGEPLLILRDELHREDSFTDRRAVGVALVAGGALAVPLLLLIMIPTLRPVAVLGLFIPALLWQDVIRYVAFARRTPGRALLADVLWLAIQGALSVAILVLHMGRGIDVWIVAWGISALISAVAISVRMRLRPRVTGSLTWARQASKISGQMFADFFVTTGAQQLVIFLVPLVSSLAVLGALKAAQVAAGPLQMGLTAASVVAIPSVARLSGEGRLDLAARRGLQLSGAVFVIGVLYTGVLVAVPVDLGMKAFGDSWIKAAHIAGFVGMQCALVGVLQGAIVVLRGTRNTRRGLIVRLWLTPLNILCPIAGAAIDGIRGLGIAMVVTASFAVVIWWGAAWRTVRTMVRQAKARPDGASRAETARERVA